MIAGLGSIRLGQILFALGCVSLQAQELIREDDGSGMLTMLYKQALWQPPNIHYDAKNGEGWTNVPGIAMVASTEGGNYSATDGWWQHAIKTSELEFVFNDNNGVWDNNKNQNYHIYSAGTWALEGTVTEAPQPPGPSYINGTGYSVVDVKKSRNSVTLHLEVNPATDGDEDEPEFGQDVKELVVDVTTSKNAVRVKISDKNAKRWEVPASLYNKGDLGNSASKSSSSNEEGFFRSDVEFTFTEKPFTFQVTRKSDGYVLFDSSALSLVFKDQYLQIATEKPADLNVYGLGESSRGTLNVKSGEKHTMWARDQGAMSADVNLYGAQPFYLGLNEAGKAHGVLLLNSNGMDISMEDDRVIYQVIGGVLDFNIVSGPTPADVVSQYTSLIGRPKLMPYWSYGFHQCRWGYKDVAALRTVVDKYEEEKIPLDVLWADIDYMDKFYDFTLDPVNFPQEEVTKLLADVHSKDQKFVPIIDPGIPDDKSDQAYTRGLELDVYIKDTKGKPYLGQVWPGPTVFPDFFHPNATDYWSEQLHRMHEMMPYDGLWIDMNELANFCPGTSCERENGVDCPKVGDIDSLTSCCLKCTEDDNKWDHPPFAINNVNSQDAIFNKGISTSATQYGSIRQYDAHNLYGFTESIVTNAIQEKLENKRSFVLSRSTFPGSGAHVAHWTGDNAATWTDLQWSVVTIQKFGLFGIPMVGSDICGFAGNSEMELCARWTALGAFYPFARNHNNLQSIPQETYVWPEVAAVGRKFIGMRYRILPYLYTLGYQAHKSGAPIARPLFMEFPEDVNTHAGGATDLQYMLGDSLLVTPVLEKGATDVTGYVPAGTWYNLFDYSRIESTGEVSSWEVELDDMPVFIRGGSILAMHQDGAMTSTAARKTSFDIVVALAGADGKASGELYLDDGEDVDGVSKSTVVEYKVTPLSFIGSTFSANVGANKYADAKKSMLNKLVVLGVSKKPTLVTINAFKVVKDFSYDEATQMLEVPLQEKYSVAKDLIVFWH